MFSDNNILSHVRGHTVMRELHMQLGGGYGKFILADSQGARYVIKFNRFFEFTLEDETDSKRVLDIRAANGKEGMFGGRIVVRRPRYYSVIVHGSPRGRLKRPIFWFFQQRWQLTIDDRVILLPTNSHRKAIGADFVVTQRFMDVYPRVCIDASPASVEYLSAMISIVIMCMVDSFGNS